MRRVKFTEKNGQRTFLTTVIQNTRAVSLRGLKQFGITTPYSTLKNYYTQTRLLPQTLFEDLCEIGTINKNNLQYNLIANNWGQTKGGQTSKRNKQNESVKK